MDYRPPAKRIIPGLADRLRELRRQRGLSQQVLAVRAGASTNRIRDAERYGAATTDTLTRLARALGCTVDALVGRGAP